MTDATGQRVATAHRHARRGLLLSTLFAVGAVMTSFLDTETGRWMPIHLFVVGALLSAISTVTQMLAITWSTSAPPADPMITGQRWLLAVSAVVLVVGREAANDFVVAAGGFCVGAALVWLVINLTGIRRRAHTDRFAPAIDAYIVAGVSGTIGIGFGVMLAIGHSGGQAMELRQAHLTLNLFGLVGIVVAGTLPFFAATQMRTKVSPRATPAAIRTVSSLLATGVAVVVIASLATVSGLAAAGYAVIGIALLAMLRTLPVPRRRQIEWGGARLVQLAAGLTWWIGSAFALSVLELTEGDTGPVLVAMVIGAYAQILVASLAYLGPVLRGGGHEQLTAGFAVARSWVSLASLNFAALGALGEARWMVVGGLAVTAADVAVRLARLVFSARR
ncbi:MAG: hypothetical protein IPM43_10210 [Actinomycetota bacterium]|nr:MAG: hypothetical protein IPM43_10210 [Actinomycetota bacterium]